jgi:hypothetical protein
MQCKIKKITRYNVEGYDITINVSPDELERLRYMFYGSLGTPIENEPEIEMILDTINKELGK